MDRLKCNLSVASEKRQVVVDRFRRRPVGRAGEVLDPEQNYMLRAKASQGNYELSTQGGPLGGGSDLWHQCRHRQGDLDLPRANQTLNLAQRHIGNFMKLFFAILFVASTASAAVIYQSGFESPGYTPGVLAGQDGWLNITAPSGNIVVQSGISRSGTQAVDFSASGAQAFTRDSRLTGYDTSVPGNDNNVSTSTDFMLGTTGTPSAWRLTGYYSSNNFIGYLGVTASGAVTLGNMVLGTTLTRGVWYNLQVDYNFTTLQYTGYLNGVSVGSRAFSSAGATAQFGSVYFENAAPGTDHAYFDNVSVSSFSSTPVVPLVYGQTYYLQNGYNNYAGGFLDTDDIGCQGDLLCVSTASTPIRDSGSGTWMILPVTPGRALGDKVQSGDAVQLANVYGYTTVGAENAGGLVNFGGFLDTSGQGCQDNLLCVATSSSSNRDSGSGTWRIELTAAAASVGSTVNSGDGFTLKNGSANFNGGYLDTRGIGCQNNLLCVSTASVINRDNGSGTWKASVPPPPAALVYGQTYYLQNGYQDFRRGATSTPTA